MSNEDAINQIETALRARYHVPTLDGLGPLPGAIESARQGDFGPLREALNGRELYRWQGAVDDALAALTSPAVEPDESSEIEGTVEERLEDADEGEQVGTFLPDESEAPMAEPTTRSRKKN